ncbi:MAG: glycosyltransferase family 87 protein [Candidatus Thorarchaeota archaeon]
MTKLNRSTLILELLFFLPFSVYLFSIFLSRHESSGFSKYTLLIIIVFALIFQVVILFTNVSLSDDIYRFYYEGKGLVNGINPYVTPVQEFPDNLKDQYFEEVNNPYVTSPYPPLAIFIFAVLYLISPTPIIYRICFSLSFLVSVLGCYKIIDPETKWKLIIYAWNPLLHIETANGSHFDVIVALMIIIMLLCLKAERLATAGFFLVLGFLLKYYPILLVFAFWKQYEKRGLVIIFIGVLSYVLLVLVNPFLIQGLIIYLEDWYFNASIFWLVYALLNYFLLSKIIVGITILIILTIIAFKSQIDYISSYRSAVIIIGSLLLLQPVFHPWYIFWLFPFLIIDNKMNLSWIFLSGTLVLSYHVYILYDTIGIWIESNLIRMTEYLPFFSVLIFENWVFDRIKHKKVSELSNKMKL